MGPLVHCWVAEQYFGKKIFNQNKDQMIFGSTAPDILAIALNPIYGTYPAFRKAHHIVSEKVFPKYFAEAYNLHLKLDNFMHKNYIFKLAHFLQNEIGKDVSHDTAEFTFDLLLNADQDIFYEFPNIRKEKFIFQKLEDKFGKGIILEKLVEPIMRWKNNYMKHGMNNLVALCAKDKTILTKSQVQNNVNKYAGLLKDAKRCSEYVGKELDYLDMLRSFPPIKNKF